MTLFFSIGVARRLNVWVQKWRKSDIGPFRLPRGEFLFGVYHTGMWRVKGKTMLNVIIGGEGHTGEILREGDDLQYVVVEGRMILK